MRTVSEGRSEPPGRSASSNKRTLPAHPLKSSPLVLEQISHRLPPELPGPTQFGPARLGSARFLEAPALAGSIVARGDT